MCMYYMYTVYIYIYTHHKAYLHNVTVKQLGYLGAHLVMAGLTLAYPGVIKGIKDQNQ